MLRVWSCTRGTSSSTFMPQKMVALPMRLRPTPGTTPFGQVEGELHRDHPPGMRGDEMEVRYSGHEMG